MHHLHSWIKRDQLDATCFIISLFTAQHVSDVNTSILRSLQLILWVISWVVLFWFNVCWCYIVVWLGWCAIQNNTTHEITHKISCKLLRMDVLTSETCWAVNNEIIKQVTSSWSIFIQQLYVFAMFNRANLVYFELTGKKCLRTHKWYQIKVKPSHYRPEEA